MTYQALARKWRPRRFEDMVGQGHVLQALRTALSQQRLHHAYLFTGTRGVGKTTVARIFAKSLNCEQGVSPSPCGVCAACQEVDSGRFVDLIEVDAASRTKVEDTRELLDNVQYLPTRGRYKVYLIDEVHMLSNSSFNALLKTLEEPPSHVVFLLATTDPQKLPATVLSRCLQFHLKALSREQIDARLAHILDTENVSHDAESLKLVARAAEGSLRDALSLLDQAIAHGEGKLEAPAVREMLGFIEHASIDALVQALIAADFAPMMSAVQAMANFAPDFDQVLVELLSTLHAAAIVQQLPDAPQADNALAVQLAGALDAELIQLYYQIAVQGRRDLPLAPTPREGLEMTLLRMLAFRPHERSAPQRVERAGGRNAEADAARATVSAQPATVGGSATGTFESETTDVRGASISGSKKTDPKADAQTDAIAARIAAARANAAQAAAKHSDHLPPWEDDARAMFVAPPDAEPQAAVWQPPSAINVRPSALTDERDEWEDTLDQLALTGLTDSLARNSACLESHANRLVLAVDAKQLEFWTPARREELQRAFADKLARNIEIDVRTGIPEHTMTPQQRAQVRAAEKLAAAQAAFVSDPRLLEILRAGLGQVLMDSIKPLN